MDLTSMITMQLPKALDQHSPTIAKDVMYDYEMSTLQLDQDPSPETRFLQQEIQARFFGPDQSNDRCLIYHGLGSGKCVHPDTLVEVLDSESKEPSSIPIHRLWHDYADFIIHDPETPHAYWATLRQPLTVMSYDTAQGIFIPRLVTALYKQLVQELLCHLTIDQGDGTLTELLLTKKHRVWTPLGWRQDLHVGDSVFMTDGQWHTISLVDQVPYVGYVFDLEVYGTHSYMSNQIVTHNTCTAALIHEHFRQSRLSSAPRAPALVIVINRDAILQYESDLFNVCSKDLYTLPDSYEEEPELGAPSGRDRRREAIRRALQDSYQFETMEAFARVIESLGATAIQARYSYRDIFIDEAHKLRPFLQWYHVLLHSVVGCRAFLMTGSPIWDRVSELPSLYNLLLDMDHQFTDTGAAFVRAYFGTAKSSRMIPEKRNEFKERIQGLTSYLRTKLSGTIIHHEGVTAPLVRYYPVQPCVMSDFQSKILRPLWTKTTKKQLKQRARDENAISEEEGIDLENNASLSVVLRGPREAAMFVFPDGSYGGQGFNTHIALQGKGKDKAKTKGKTGKRGPRILHQYAYKDPRVLHEVRDNLKVYSAKFHVMIQEMLARPQEVTLIYIESVHSGGGVINLGLILNSMPEFRWVRRAADLVTARQPHEPRRFVVFSSGEGTTNDSNEIRRMIEINNQPSNRYGDHCSLIIISKKMATGTNLLNVRRFYQFPHWNFSLPRQASGRTERAGGHDAFPMDERYIDQSVLVSVYPGTDATLDSGESYSLEQTIDLYIHDIAESKDAQNADALRAMIESCWDCALTYARNALPLAVDGSPECFYQDCDYLCDGYDLSQPQDAALVDTTTKPWTYHVPPAGQRDYSNYFLHDRRLDKAYLTSQLEYIFQRHFLLSLLEIYQLLQADLVMRQYLILDVLHDIIHSQRPMINQYGQTCYLRESMNQYYLVRSLAQDQPGDSILARSPLAVQSLPLSEVLILHGFQSDQLLLGDILKHRRFTRDAIEALQYDTFLLFIEIGIHRHELGPILAALYPEHILGWSRDHDVPVTESTQGWVHNFRTAEYHGRGLPPSGLFNKDTSSYRILDPDHGIPYWEYAPETWVPALTQIFMDKIPKARTPKSLTREDVPGGIFAYMNEKNKFTIRVIQQPGKRPAKGSVCAEGGWAIKRLLGLFMDLNFYPEGNYPGPLDDLHAQLISLLTPKIKSEDQIKALTQSQASRLLALYHDASAKSRMCRLLKQWFEEHGLMYTFTIFDE